MENGATYDTEETALVLVAVPPSEAAELIGKINTSGYEAVQFKGIDDVLKAMGMEPTDVEDVNLEALAPFVKILLPYANRNIGGKPGASDMVRVLACVGIILADLAQTHKRAMPPLL